MELRTSYPFQASNSLEHDNVNPAMVNGYDIKSSMLAMRLILSERLYLKRFLFALYLLLLREFRLSQAQNLQLM